MGLEKLRTIDIPQADSLALVRYLVAAIAEGIRTNADLVARTGFSARHVRYRLEAAHILGFVGKDCNLTSRGRRLLATHPGSPAERAELRRAVKTSAVVKVMTIDMSSSQIFDIAKIARRIVALTGLSPATAERRAKALRSWFRQIED